MAVAPAPYGWGLSEEQFWSATPVELHALSEVRSGWMHAEAWRWANSWALFANAHFRGQHHQQPFTPEEFMGERPKPSEDKIRAELVRSGLVSEVLPDWAKRRSSDG